MISRAVYGSPPAASGLHFPPQDCCAAILYILMLKYIKCGGNEGER